MVLGSYRSLNRANRLARHTYVGNDPLNRADPTGTEVGPAFAAVNGNCTGTMAGSGCAFVKGSLENIGAMNRDDAKNKASTAEGTSTEANETSAAESTTMESRRGSRGGQGQGERGLTGKAEKPLKGAKPVRDKDGQIVGWKIRNPKDPGKDIPKSLEWGRQNGLHPEDFSSKMVQGGDNVGSVTVGAILVGGGILICAAAEPCGAIGVAAMGLGGTTMLATQ